VKHVTLSNGIAGPHNGALQLATAGVASLACLFEGINTTFAPAPFLEVRKRSDRIPATAAVRRQTNY
jgi:hypothetical protein